MTFADWVWFFKILFCRHEWVKVSDMVIVTPTARYFEVLHHCAKCEATQQHTKEVPIVSDDQAPE